MSRRELLKLPVKNSMDLADEILRDIDVDSDEEPPVTVNHVFSSRKDELKEVRSAFALQGVRCEDVFLHVHD